VADKPIMADIPIPVKHRLVWIPNDSDVYGNVIDATTDNLTDAGFVAKLAAEETLTAVLELAGFPNRGKGYPGIDHFKSILWEVVWGGSTASLAAEDARWLQAVADVDALVEGEADNG
jgi:hypothetical protein